MPNIYYRIRYENKIIGRADNREEATAKCEAHAKSMVPVVINPSQFKDASEVYTIEIIKDKQVWSYENYTVIIAMRK